VRKAYRIFVRKSEGKNPLRRPKHRWEDNIKMGITEVVCENVNWMHQAQVGVKWQIIVNVVPTFQTNILFAICFTLAISLVYSSNLKMEALYFSETLMNSTKLHGITSQKTVASTVTAVRTTNPR
jgi:hypothetical protein